MSRIILVTGGARSGKSRYAECLALPFGQPLGYLATCEPLDTEMDERVARHRERRGAEWVTLEEPLRVAESVAAHDGRFRAILVDCITLWLSNLLLAHDDPEQVIEAVRGFTATFHNLATPLILVTNEVGMGIVPENHLARLYRDLAGRANELLAAAADEVHVVISGIPLKLKG